jgi:hypothetical protein
MTRTRGVLIALLAGGAMACALPEDPGPADPDPVPREPSTVAPAPPPAGGTTPVLGSPSSSPDPTPAPDASPSPEPPAGGPPPPPAGSGCGEPYPPALQRIALNIHIRGVNFWTLDSTPLVGPDAAYCAAIGYTDGRSSCPVRPEGHPERSACETLLVGVAVDTGRPGPTWRRDGSLCTGPVSGCENDPENQYLLRAMEAGTYTACSQSGVCGEQVVDR